MNFDFEDDLAHELYNGFNSFGIKLSYRPKLQEHLLDYLTISKKIIRPQKRNVKYNPQFLRNLSIHPKANVITHLEYLFTEGKDINSFQNRRLFQSKFHDHLVYEWNIYHFHLSLEQEKKTYFKKQVKQLLFALVTDDYVIFLGDDGHVEGTFGDVKWLEILHDHFPEVMTPYKDSTLTKVYPELNSIERQRAWDAGLLLGMTEVRGVVYHSPGIGRATSRHSILVTKQVNEIMRWLYILNEQFTVHYRAICYTLNYKESTAKFKLRFGAKTFEIVEIHSNLTILTYPDVIDEQLLKIK